jgi:hypothetical protein
MNSKIINDSNKNISTKKSKYKSIKYDYDFFEIVKYDIRNYKKLTTLQEILIKQLTREEMIEIIMIYNELLESILETL